MKPKTKMILVLFTFAVALTLFANMPFGFYKTIDAQEGYLDYLYGVQFFGNWIVSPTSVLDLAYMLGAIILNFGLLYTSFLLIKKLKVPR